MAELHEKKGGERSVPKGHASPTSPKRPEIVELEQITKLLRDEKRIVENELNASQQAIALHQRTVQTVSADQKRSMILNALGPVGAIVDFWKTSVNGFRSSFGQGAIAAKELASEQKLNKTLTERRSEIEKAFGFLTQAEAKFKAGDLFGGKELQAAAQRLVPREKLEQALREQQKSASQADSARKVSDLSIRAAEVGAGVVNDYAATGIHLGVSTLLTPAAGTVAASAMRSVQSIASNSVEVGAGTKSLGQMAKDSTIDTAYGAVTETFFGKGLKHGGQLAAKVFGKGMASTSEHVTSKAAIAAFKRFTGKHGAVTAMVAGVEQFGAGSVFRRTQAEIEFAHGEGKTAQNEEERAEKHQRYLEERRLTGKQIAIDGAFNAASGAVGGYLGAISGVTRQLASSFAMKSGIFTLYDVAGSMATTGVELLTRWGLLGEKITLETAFDRMASTAMSAGVGEFTAHKTGIERERREQSRRNQQPASPTPRPAPETLTDIDMRPVMREGKEVWVGDNNVSLAVPSKPPLRATSPTRTPVLPTPEQVTSVAQRTLDALKASGVALPSGLGALLDRNGGQLRSVNPQSLPSRSFRFEPGTVMAMAEEGANGKHPGPGETTKRLDQQRSSDQRLARQNSIEPDTTPRISRPTWGEHVQLSSAKVTNQARNIRDHDIRPRSVFLRLESLLDSTGRLTPEIASAIRNTVRHDLPLAVFSERSFAEISKIFELAGQPTKGLYLVLENGRAYYPDGEKTSYRRDGYAAHELQSPDLNTSRFDSARRAFYRFGADASLKDYEIVALGREMDPFLLYSDPGGITPHPHAYAVNGPDSGVQLLAAFGTRVRSDAIIENDVRDPQRLRLSGPLDASQEMRMYSLDRAADPTSTEPLIRKWGPFVERVGYDDYSLVARNKTGEESAALLDSIIDEHPRYGELHRKLRTDERSHIAWQEIPVQKRRELQQYLSEHHPELLHAGALNDKGSIALHPHVRAWFLLDYLHSAPGKIRRDDVSYLKRDPQLGPELIDRFAHAIEKHEPVEFFFTSFAPKFPTNEISGGFAAPDAAHFLALLNVHAIADGASAIYSPGIRFHIAYEGGLFPDLSGVTPRIANETFRSLQESNLKISDALHRSERPNPVEIIDAVTHSDRLLREVDGRADEIVRRTEQKRAEYEKSELLLRLLGFEERPLDAENDPMAAFDASFGRARRNEILGELKAFVAKVEKGEIPIPQHSTRERTIALLHKNIEYKTWLRNFSLKVKTDDGMVGFPGDMGTFAEVGDDLRFRMYDFFARSELKYQGGDRNHGIMNFHQNPENLINITVDSNRPGKTPRLNIELIPGWDARPHHAVAARVVKGDGWAWKESTFADLIQNDRVFMPIFLSDSTSPFYYAELRQESPDSISIRLNDSEISETQRRILLDEQGNRYLHVRAGGDLRDESSYAVLAELERLRALEARNVDLPGRLESGIIFGETATHNTGPGEGAEYLLRINPGVETDYLLHEWSVPQ